MQKYNCKNCGAELYWDSNAECLKCEYCGHEYQVSEFENQDIPQEDTKEKAPEQADEHAKATDDSDSIDLVVYKCTHCSAEIITARSTVATTCAYCGRAISMTDKLVDDFKPDVVIPFLCDEEKAKEIYKAHINSSVLTPKDFVSESVIKKMKGVYVPFWLHSFEVNAHTRIYGENLVSNRRGDDKIVHHHMYNVSRHIRGEFADIPTDALKNLDNTLMGAIEPFDYGKIEEFNPAYMAGFYAEEYNENAEDTGKRALSRAKSSVQQVANRVTGSYSVEHVQSSDVRYSEVTSKYAMLPVWLLHVEHRGKDYLFAINGESGKIAGKLPVSKKKAAKIALLPPLITYIIMYLIMLLLSLVK